MWTHGYRETKERQETQKKPSTKPDDIRFGAGLSSVKPGFMLALQRQRQLVIPVQAGPAAVHAGDKRGPANIAGARPDKLALVGIKMPEQTSQMIKIIKMMKFLTELYYLI